MSRLKSLFRFLIFQFSIFLLVPIASICAQSSLSDTTRLLQLLEQTHRTDADTSLIGSNARRVLAESRQIGFLEGEATAYQLLGYLQSYQGQSVAALRLYRRAEKRLLAQARIRPTKRLYYSLGVTVANMARNEYTSGQVQTGISDYLRAGDFARAAHDYDGLIFIYGNLSVCFNDLDQPVKEQYYIRQSISMSSQPLQHPERLLTPYSALIIQLSRDGQLTEARRFLKQAQLLLKLPSATYYLEDYENAKGIYFLESGSYQRAKECFFRCLRTETIASNPYLLGIIHRTLAETFQALGETANARANLLQGLEYSRQGQNQTEEARTLLSLAELEEKQGVARIPAALAYFKQAKKLTDKLASEKVRRNTAMLETQYRTREQQQQIKILHAQQEVQQEALHRKTLLSYAAFTVAGLLGCAIILANNTLRANRKLAAQQQELQARQLETLELERQHVATEAMLHGQDAERRRVARDLHDGLGGTLSTVKHYLGAMRGTLPLPPASEALFSQAVLHLDNSIGELRRVAHDMMPMALQRFGLVPALQDLCQSLNHGPPPSVQFQMYGLSERLPQRIELVVYRLVQELLNNALKHAAAQQLIVQLSCHDAQVQLVVEDDGRGFVPAAAHAGMGLRNIQARADYLRGDLNWHSVPGEGTAVTLSFPLSHE